MQWLVVGFGIIGVVSCAFAVRFMLEQHNAQTRLEEAQRAYRESESRLVALQYTWHRYVAMLGDMSSALHLTRHQSQLFRVLIQALARIPAPRYIHRRLPHDTLAMFDDDDMEELIARVDDETLALLWSERSYWALHEMVKHLVALGRPGGQEKNRRASNVA